MSDKFPVGLANCTTAARNVGTGKNSARSAPILVESLEAPPREESFWVSKARKSDLRADVTTSQVTLISSPATAGGAERQRWRLALQSMPHTRFD